MAGVCMVRGMLGRRCAWWGHAWWGGGMHGSRVCVVVGACVAGGMHGRGHMWQGACMAWGYVVGGGWACVAGEMATAADGTHPTGMQLCLLIVPDCGDVKDCHAETERLPSDHQHRGSSLETAQALPCTGVHRRRGISIRFMFTLRRHVA